MKSKQCKDDSISSVQWPIAIQLALTISTVMTSEASVTSNQHRTSAEKCILTCFMLAATFYEYNIRGQICAVPFNMTNISHSHLKYCASLYYVIDFFYLLVYLQYIPAALFYFAKAYIVRNLKSAFLGLSFKRSIARNKKVSCIF